MRIFGFIFRLVIRYFVEETFNMEKIKDIKAEDVERITNTVISVIANRAKTAPVKESKKTDGDEALAGLTDGYNYY